MQIPEVIIREDEETIKIIFVTDSWERTLCITGDGEVKEINQEEKNGSFRK